MKNIFLIIITKLFFLIGWPVHVHAQNKTILLESYKSRDNKKHSDSLFSLFMTQWHNESVLLMEKQKKFEANINYDKNIISLVNTVITSSITPNYKISKEYFITEDTLLIIRSPNGTVYKLPAGIIKHNQKNTLLLTKEIESEFVKFLRKNAVSGTTKDSAFLFLSSHGIPLNLNPETEAQPYMWTLKIRNNNRSKGNDNYYIFPNLPFVAYLADLNEKLSDVFVYVYTNCCLISYKYMFTGEKWQLANAKKPKQKTGK